MAADVAPPAAPRRARLPRGARRARPTTFADAVSALDADSYDAKLAAVERLAALRDDRAIRVLAAMEDGRLFVRASDGLLLVGESRGRDYALTGALDGQDYGLESAGRLDKVRVNNRVRGAIRAALGRLQLQHADPQRRMAAVDDVLRERSPEAAELLRAALAAETDPEVRAAMEFGVAAMDLAGDDPRQAPRRDRSAGAARSTRRRAGCSARSRPTRAPRPRSRPPPRRRSPRSSATGAWSSWSPTSTRASRSARSCCSPRSGSPSPSA